MREAHSSIMRRRYLRRLFNSLARSLVFLQKEFQRGADPLRFFVNVGVVWLPIDSFVRVRVWIKAAVRVFVCQIRHVGERNISFPSDAQHVVDVTLRDTVEPCNGAYPHQSRRFFHAIITCSWKCLLSLDFWDKSRSNSNDRISGFQARTGGFIP